MMLRLACCSLHLAPLVPHRGPTALVMEASPFRVNSTWARLTESYQRGFQASRGYFESGVCTTRLIWRLPPIDPR